MSAVVDELANAETSLDSREQITRCLGILNQVLWLGEGNWPSIVGTDEESDTEHTERFHSNGMRPRSSIRIDSDLRCEIPDCDSHAADEDEVIEIRHQSFVSGNP